MSLSGTARVTLDRMLWPTLLPELYCPDTKRAKAVSHVQSFSTRHFPEQGETEGDKAGASALPALSSTVSAVG